MEEYQMQEYRNRIRELREEKHITQVRLSTELGVAQETISAYEQGRHLPAFETGIHVERRFYQIRQRKRVDHSAAHCS